MSRTTSTFTCTHSGDLPGLLRRLNCTLAVSTYQAGKVIFISAAGDDRLVQLLRTFDKPMGISADDKRMAIATQTEVVVFNNASRMAANYPNQPATYDALYLPRASYYTGEVDIHDLYWCNDTLWAVNTRFSCLCKIDHHYSFTPVWRPFFISKLSPDDRCHLNGVAFSADAPKYATALGKTDQPEGWRGSKATGGVVIDIERNELITERLAMPHSPRLYDGQLYLLLSATGELIRIDTSTGKTEALLSVDGFVRGMDRCGDHLFIGVSKLREKSATFSDLPIARKSVFCGIVIVHMPTFKIAGFIKYEDSVEEIYDVRVLAGLKRPGLLNHYKTENRLPLATPQEDFWPVLKDKQKK